MRKNRVGERETPTGDGNQAGRPMRADGSQNREVPAHQTSHPIRQLGIFYQMPNLDA